MSIAVYKYGLLAPLDWDEECDAELRGMNRLWNALVEIERNHRERYLGLLGEHHGLAALNREIEAAKERLGEIKALKGRRRAAARSKKIETLDLDEEARAVKARMRHAIEAAKPLRAEARERSRAALAALEAERKAAVKTARQNSGLYWGNYNAIIASYETGRQRAIKEGADLHFRRFNGSGRLVAQIIGGIAAEDMLAGESTQIRIRPPSDGAWDHSGRGERRRRQRTTLEMAVYSRDRTPRRVTWPMIMHRPLPEGAIVKQATVTKRQRGRQEKWEVSILLRLPAAEPAEPGGGVCGINLGWRRLHRQTGHVKTGAGLRAATIASVDGIEHVELPEEIISRADHCADLQSAIDERVNIAMPALRALPWQDIDPGEDTPFARAIRAARTAPKPTAGTLGRLVYHWGAEAPDFAPEALTKARSAVRLNDRDRTERVNVLASITASRREIYRLAAKRLCRINGVIVIDQADWRTIGEGDSKDEQPQRARFYRRLAAPAELVSALNLMAEKHGAQVIKNAASATGHCHACGAVTDYQPAADLIHTCRACGTSWDQDVNAAKNHRAWALSSADNIRAIAVEKSAAYEGRYQRAKRMADEKRAALENVED